MKKSLLNDKAQTLYVEDLWSYEAIALEVGCSERSVRNWSRDGRWDLKRKNFTAIQESISDDVRTITTQLAKKLIEQLADEMEPSPHIINAYTRLAQSLLTVRKYEQSIEQDYNSQNKNNDDKQIAAAAKFKEVFGVDLED